MKVTDPHGQTWRIRRRWLPWRKRISTPDWVPDGGRVLAIGDDPVSMFIGAISMILLIPAFIFLLLISLEFLLLLLLLPLVLLARILFGHAWVVEVRRGWSLYWDEQSGGWRESGSRIESIGGLISQGQLPPRNVGR